MRVFARTFALVLLLAACGSENEIAAVPDEFGTVVIRVRAQNQTAAAGVPTFISQAGGVRLTAVTNSSGLAQYDSVKIGLWQAGWNESSAYVVVDATTPTTMNIAVSPNRTTEASFTARRQVTDPIDRERRGYPRTFP